MKKLPLLLVALFGFGVVGLTTATAGEVVKEKTVYVVEDGRPVQRKLFFEHGHYYRVEGRKHIIVEHVSEKYPDKYFDHDGHARPGIRIDF